MNLFRNRDPESVMDDRHRAAQAIDCPTCDAKAGEWCPIPGTTWYLHPERIEQARKVG